MIPDRDGDTVRDAAATGEVANEAARVATGAVPAPRPEVLARVLHGLRDLPAAPPGPRAGPAGDEPALPLPRRRS
ncbi:hypothetical protein PHK61_04370 [Actinomycetospora lutea]|uniref:hypothetical protein n=1 Tax=Actinomycetospora lutea TaxID=663604 RepID=UPI002365179E|nr:hypothetical protein [Actinomycetospora lutea]MDD7937654.1 hypothetical protein [Actinomycetospora lutea]